MVSVLYLCILLNLSCPAVSQKSMSTLLYLILVSVPVHTVEPLLSCCIPEVYEHTPVPSLGSVPVQVQGKGGQLLRCVAKHISNHKNTLEVR